MVIEKIAVLGGGTMGHGIAHTFSRFGYDVNIYEPFDAVREHIIEKVWDELNFLVDEAYITKEEAQSAVDHLHLFSDLQSAVADADYILEACPENLNLKQSLFAQLEQYCKPTAVFSSNTSSLKLGDITANLSPAGKARSMICHWYNPPYLLPIAELSKFGNMNEELFQAVYELYVKCEKQPVRVLKDIPGMVANRLLHAQAREAFYLAEIGAAEKEDLDKALKYGPSFRNATTGMLEVADMGGLDIWLAAEDNLFSALCNSDKASESLRSQVAQGRLGVKNGKGFYEYSDEQKAKAQREFYKRLLIQLRASKNY